MKAAGSPTALSPASAGGSSSPASPPPAAAGEDAAQRRQRLREQMRAFYGTAASGGTHPSSAGAVGHPLAPPRLSPGSSLTHPSPGSAAVAAAAAGPSSPPPPCMDLNSEMFQVQQYTTDLLHRETLQGLVEKDTQLLRSVRQLDRDLQELVYRNYAKFISATDTISDMRRHVSDMDIKLCALHQHMELVSGTSQQVFAALAPHREKVEETITTARKRKKAAFLQHLPQTLEGLRREGKFGDCVHGWVVGDAFFSKYFPPAPAATSQTTDNAKPSTLSPAALAALSALRRQCWAVVIQVYHDMEEEVSKIPLDDPAAMDSIHQLVGHLRLLRATSVFSDKTFLQEQQQQQQNNNNNNTEFDDDAARRRHTRSSTEAVDDVSFAESVRRVLMRSVQKNFAHEISAVHVALHEVLWYGAVASPPPSPPSPSSATNNTKTTTTEGGGYRLLPALASLLRSLPLADRHQPIEQLNIREPLAHLKGACALLAANSHRIHDLLQQLQDGGGPAVGRRKNNSSVPDNSSGKTEEDAVATHIAAHVQPALMEMLTPLRTCFVSLIYTYCRVLFGDDSSPSPQTTDPNHQQQEAQGMLYLLHRPHRVRQMMQQIVAALVRQCRQMGVTLKEMGHAYLNTPLRRFQSHGYTRLVDETITSVLLAASDVARSTFLLQEPPSFGPRVDVCRGHFSPSTTESIPFPQASGAPYAADPGCPYRPACPPGVSIVTLLGLALAPATSADGNPIGPPSSSSSPQQQLQQPLRLPPSASFLSFILHRFAFVSFLSCVRQHVVQQIQLTEASTQAATTTTAAGGAGGDAAIHTGGRAPVLPLMEDTSLLRGAVVELDRSIDLLLHRAVLLEGQYSLYRLLPVLVGGGSVASPPADAAKASAGQEEAPDPFMCAASAGASSSTPPGAAPGPSLHPAVLSIVLLEWSYLARLLHCLPAIQFTSVSFGTRQHKQRGGGREGDGSSSVYSGSQGGTAGGAYAAPYRTASASTAFSPLRMGAGDTGVTPSLVSSTAGGCGSPEGLGLSAAHVLPAAGPRRLDGRQHQHQQRQPPLVVAYRRREMTSLQHHIDAIFSAQSSAVLETLPANGMPGTILKCVMIFVLRGILDAVREVRKQQQQPSHGTLEDEDEDEEDGDELNGEKAQPRRLEHRHPQDQSATPFSFPNLQLHCTFLLHLLLDAAPAPSPQVAQLFHQLTQAAATTTTTTAASLSTGTVVERNNHNSGRPVSPQPLPRHHHSASDTPTGGNGWDAALVPAQRHPEAEENPPAVAADPEELATAQFLFALPSAHEWWWAAATAPPVAGTPTAATTTATGSGHAASLRGGGGAEESVKAVQRELDEICMSAYERAADPVVPLAQQEMDRLMRESVEQYLQRVGHFLLQARAGRLSHA